MSSPFASILKNVNRKNNIYDILFINHDEVFQFELAKTGHNFYCLVSNNLRPWDVNIRPLPHNVHMVSIDEINSHLGNQYIFDLILCQNRFIEFEIVNKLRIKYSCPIISFEQNLVPKKMNQFYIESLSDQEYNQVITTSNLIDNSWGTESTHIIKKTIDTDIFHGWTGKDGYLLSVIDNDEKQILEEIQAKGLLGKIKVLIKHNTPLKQLIMAYQNCSRYINFNDWKIQNNSVLEAMSCGCPIISIYSQDIEELVDENNGVVIDDITHISSAVENINNTILMKNDSRKKILEHFSIKQFVHDWNQVFDETIGYSQV